MDDGREIEIGDIDLLDIRVEQLEEIIGNRRLLRVFHTNAQLVGVGRRKIESQRIVVAHRLDEFEEIDHIHTQHILLRTVITLKAITVETEIDKNSVSLIYCHHLNALTIKFKIGFCQDLF